MTEKLYPANDFPVKKETVVSKQTPKRQHRPLEPTARSVAVSVILQVRFGQEAVQAALDTAYTRLQLSGRERPLCTELVYGTLRNYARLEFFLRHFLERFDALPREMGIALCVAVYELFYTRVPVYATVDTFVALIRRQFGQVMGKVANGVLRNIDRSRSAFHDEQWYIQQCGTPLAALACRHSVPEWLVEVWEQAYGPERTRLYLEASSQAAPNTLRFNVSGLSRRGGHEKDPFMGDEQKNSPPGAVQASGCMQADEFTQGGEFMEDTGQRQGGLTGKHRECCPHTETLDQRPCPEKRDLVCDSMRGTPSLGNALGGDVAEHGKGALTLGREAHGREAHDREGPDRSTQQGNSTRQDGSRRPDIGEEPNVWGSLDDRRNGDVRGAFVELFPFSREGKQESCPVGADAAEQADRAEAVWDSFFVVPQLAPVLSFDGPLPEEAAAFMKKGLVSQQSGAVLEMLSAMRSQEWRGPVWDCCCGRGGKTLALLEQGIDVAWASDISRSRLRGLEEELARLGLDGGCHVERFSATEPVTASQFYATTGINSFGTILVDAPCSGFGTLARHPEIRFRRTRQDVAKLAALQRGILDNACRWLAEAGKLVYITCTLMPQENDEQIARFVKEHQEMRLCHTFQIAASSFYSEFFYGACLEKTGPSTE